MAVTLAMMAALRRRIARARVLLPWTRVAICAGSRWGEVLKKHEREDAFAWGGELLPTAMATKPAEFLVSAKEPVWVSWLVRIPSHISIWETSRFFCLIIA